MSRTDTAVRVINAPPDRVFAALTPTRLPGPLGIPKGGHWSALPLAYTMRAPGSRPVTRPVWTSRSAAGTPLATANGEGRSDCPAKDIGRRRARESWH